MVSYGDPAALVPLFESIERQTLQPARVRVWHNGPRFDLAMPALARLSVESSGENLGFGEGINRLFATAETSMVIVANPDLVFDERCIEHLVDELATHPEATVVGATLVDKTTRRLNAYGHRLTWDLVGINTDRGRDFDEFMTAVPRELGSAPQRYVGPSGALFAVNRERWLGGPLFVKSFFLYLEDVALWIKLRRAGAEIRFRPDAWAEHAWSTSTGTRSALKLYHVERNRLWLSRALLGNARAAAMLGFTALRYGAHLVTGGASGVPDRGLAAAFRRALRDGIVQPVPADLLPYLGPERPLARSYFASLRDQLVDPVA
ncbi:MAG: glycosyltransferase [Kofleriaceae bacterium]